MFAKTQFCCRLLFLTANRIISGSSSSLHLVLGPVYPLLLRRKSKITDLLILFRLIKKFCPSFSQINKPGLFVVNTNKQTRNMFFTRIAGLFGRSSSSSTVFSHQPQNVFRALAPSMITPAGVIAASPSSRILSPLLPSLSPPAAYQLTQVRTFRDKDVLKLRCNACYFKKEDDRWWVLCSKHPRHKQRAKVEDHRLKWIVTHITRTGSYRRKHFQYAHQDI